MSGQHSRRGGGNRHQRGYVRSGGPQSAHRRHSSFEDSYSGDNTGGRSVPLQGQPGRVYGRGTTSNSSQRLQAAPSQQRDPPRRRSQGEHVTQPRASQQPPQRHQAPYGNTPQRRRWTKEDIDGLLISSTGTILDKISDDRLAFLNTYHFYDTDFYMKKLIELLVLLTYSTHPEKAGSLISEVFETCNKFMMKLGAFIQTQAFSEEKNTSIHLQRLVHLGEFCVRNIPQSSMFVFPMSQLKDCITKVQFRSPEKREFQELKKAVTSLETEFDEAQKAYLRTRRQIAKVPVADEAPNPHDFPPPDDFRQIPILPVANEIKDHNSRPFLRPSIVKGVYHNWDHYLDVQFRLLREDFMAPLRDGIHGYLHGTQHNRDILVYEGVHVLAPMCLYTGIGFIVQFDLKQSRLTKVRWEHSRKLIFGSLVCLSQDHFKSIVFGSVVKRDPKLLEQGQIVIKFEDDTNAFTIDPATEFLMVESTAYFEAYRHVLEALQELSVDQIQFKPYIVGGFQRNDLVDRPFHFRHDATLDLNLVLGLKVARRPLQLKDVSYWPRCEDTCLDKSQLGALQMALSQELSVIQGPPGTGKTYIGLKIVQALLQNRSKWDPKGTTPILVVCYTNHALDQFLTGIISDCKVSQSKPKIVRVGGRCKSEEIKHFAMGNLVSKLRAEHKVPHDFYRKQKVHQGERKALQEYMVNFSKSLDPTEGKILSIEDLRGVMLPRHYSQLVELCLTGIDSGKELECWLGLWILADHATELQSPQHQDTSEEAQIAAAIEASLQLQEEVQLAAEEAKNGEAEVFIDVEDEPQLIEDDRILEGEDEFLVQPMLGKQEQAVTSSGPTHLATKKKEDGGWQVKQPSSRERMRKITKGLNCTPMQLHHVQHVTDIWQLSREKRWQLYKHWQNQHIFALKHHLHDKSQQYNYICQECQELNEKVNLLTFQDVDVVGMTTTGAAKHSYLLKNLNPKIVIVEEAAEVLESHIITSLSANTQQLVLIGDHKQLKPKATYYELEKKYNFNVSLFERLARSGFPVATLEVQRRMRPEIASIVADHIYDGKLKNHITVCEYHPVRGVGKNLYFIDHSQPEKDNPTGDQRSHANSFEADYLVALCRYLLKQGYLPTDITMLTMYRGQLFELKHKMQRKEFEGVRVAAVDDFQGEENRIVLLSLVRSNNEGKIGFLKIENRVCVALSRAKEGMFVIGNLAMLRDKDSTKWPLILRDLERQDYVGEGLPLQCQVHPKMVIYAKTPSDFSRCPEGGCQQPCGMRLQCGHVCRSPCHPIDREHKQMYNCQQLCNKPLPCDHRCRQKCFHCVYKGCLPCTTPIVKRANCGHYQEMNCSQDPSKFECMKQCKKILPCGHCCQAHCSEPHTTKCMEKVHTTLSCGHQTNVECHTATSLLKCPVPCNALLDCGHYCSGTCGDCHKGRLHIRCTEECDRNLACGHICDFPCTANCPPCTKLCGNYCHHSKCPKKCYEPCVPCRERCQWSCKHYTCRAPCGDKCDRPRCDTPCKKQLPCGHQCIGLCGEECPTLCGVCNHEQVYNVFFGTEEPGAKFIQLKDCGHIHEVSAMDHWMDEVNDQVKFKECPQCKVAIRRSHRYGNIIKQTLKDMEEIKRRSAGDGRNFVQTVVALERTVSRANKEVQSCKQEFLTVLTQRIKERLKAPLGWRTEHGPWLFPHHINTIQNQLLLIPQIAKVYKCLDSLGSSTVLSFATCRVLHLELVQEVRALTTFLNADYLTDQQLYNAHSEFRRLFSLTRLCQLKKTAADSNCTLDRRDEVSLTVKAEELLECGWKKPAVTAQEEANIDELLQTLTERYKLGSLTESERLQIVEAIGLSKGHWFKCPNGHFYCIGECGGATEEGRCPECHATIGGTNHMLRADNTLAEEMDGASFPAWSEAANLANFDLDNLH